MNDISSREEEFFARFERFKARMRELRGLRVNQFLGLLDQNQQRKVLLIEKEVEEFVRKFAYGGGLKPLLQESILTAFNSDQVMRRRIELQSQDKVPGGLNTLQARAAKGSTPTARPSTTEPKASAPDGTAGGNGGNGTKSTGFFHPTPAEISRQACTLMGGKRVTDQSLSALQKAIETKLGGNGDGGSPTPDRQVKLSLTSAGKVSILVDKEAGR